MSETRGPNGEMIGCRYCYTGKPCVDHRPKSLVKPRTPSYLFRLEVFVDEDMGFNTVTSTQTHLEEAIRDAGDAGISVNLVSLPVPPDANQIPMFPSRDVQSSRQAKLDRLSILFSREMSEDGQDGTDFDCAVLDAFDDLKKRWGLNLNRQGEVARIMKAATQCREPACTEPVMRGRTVCITHDPGEP